VLPAVAMRTGETLFSSKEALATREVNSNPGGVNMGSDTTVWPGRGRVQRGLYSYFSGHRGRDDLISEKDGGAGMGTLHDHGEERRAIENGSKTRKD